MSSSKTEWRYWVDEVPGEPSAGMVPMVRPHLTALRDAGVLDLVEGDEEIADGVTLLLTPGHTPGHMSVLVASGGETCIVAGDVVLTEWAFEQPEWTSTPEVDPGPTFVPDERCSIGSSRAAVCSPRSTSPSSDVSRLRAMCTCSCRPDQGG